MAASRRLYIELASTIRRHVEASTTHQADEAIRTLVADLAGDLKQDNMLFDRARFLAACGLA